MPTPRERLESLANLQRELLATKREAEELGLRITRMLEEAAEEEVRLTRQVQDKAPPRAPKNAGRRK
jgi:hypothetical protein